MFLKQISDYSKVFTLLDIWLPTGCWTVFQTLTHTDGSHDVGGRVMLSHHVNLITFLSNKICAGQLRRVVSTRNDQNYDLLLF